MERMLPGGALILFIRGLIPNEKMRFALFWNNLGRLGALGFLRFFVFGLLYRGLTPYEKNVAWRGTYSFHRGLTPYEKVRFALF